MDTIGEFMHEIAAVIIFCSAMALLIFLTNSSYTGNDSVAQATEQRVNIKESAAGFSESVTVDGATVVTDIIANAEQYPNATYKIDAYVVPSTTISMIAEKSKKDGVSYTDKIKTDLMAHVTSTSQYDKSFSYNSNGEPAVISYQLHK